MVHESNKCRVIDRAAGFPAQQHRLLPIVKTLLGHSLKMAEGVLMPPDQGEELAVGGKVNVLPPGKAQDIGEAENLGFAASGKSDRIGAPIHLSLEPGIGLKSHD